jgi:AcrR family transcriptional regulator
MSRPATGTVSARDRILDAAEALFYEDGLHVGISRIIARAEVNPNTLYRHFPSKDLLVAAALEKWSVEWLHWLRQSTDRPGGPPETRIAALWDTLDEWFATDGFRGSFIVNAAAVLGGRPAHPARAVIARHRLALHRVLEDLARSAGARPPSGLADDLQVLLDGAIAMATVDRRPAVVAGLRALASTAAGITSGITC